MKKRVYIRNKHFLLNFISIAMILLFMILAFLFGIYQTSVNTLEQEIKGVNENSTKEFMYRVEEILDQCGELAANIWVNETVKLFFTHSNPEYLVDNYYDELNGILNVNGVSYVDSLILYSPKTEKYYGGGKYDTGYTISEIVKKTNEVFDISWMDHLDDEERTSTEIFIRAKANRWPYYITLMKQYRWGNQEGVVLVNLDLQKLYNHLMAGRENTIQLFLVDDAQRVIVRKGKNELYKKTEEIELLQEYRHGESFSEISGKSEERTVYVQLYSEKYGFTCVTVSAVTDYLERISIMQHLFMGGITLAVFVAIALAVLYSVKMEKPIWEIRDVLEKAGSDTKDDIKYGENISDIVDWIVSSMQVNSRLRQELELKLDLLKDSQMVALQSQINPHFLFNTLNRISLMIDSNYSDKKCLVGMISDLSAILRYALTDAKITSIREEIQYIKKYLSIMQYRYGNFSVSIDVEEKMYQYAIPKLVLQPLVENALQHGIAALIPSRACSLNISIKKIQHCYGDGREREAVCIEIADNGIGIGEEELKKLQKGIVELDKLSAEHIGVRNVAQRFQLLFQEEQEMILESVFGEGTCIRIFFPGIIIEGSENI